MSLTALRTKSMFNTNYSTSDLIYYVGLMTGLGASYAVLGQMADLHPVVRMIVSLGIGVCVGWAAERVYKTYR